MQVVVLCLITVSVRWFFVQLTITAVRMQFEMGNRVLTIMVKDQGNTANNIRRRSRLVSGVLCKFSKQAMYIIKGCLINFVIG